ncbi:MAG: nitrogenase molybdenum-iron protein beta chain [Treponematales bacterium]
MAQLHDQPRYKCALGAMQTVQAIPGAIPVLHSGPGCAVKVGGGTGSSGKFSPNIFPCTSVSEKEVVFGGTDKLRSTIENAIKVIDADLFVVLTGCTQEIIGDDAASVVEEFAGAEKRVIFAGTPGFKGNNYEGHDWVLQAIFDSYLSQKAPEKQKGLVNIFSSPPQQDAFWLGNLRELERLVATLGLTPNTIFGHGRGLPNINRIPAAEFNILVSPWAGFESAKSLENKYGAPLLHYPTLPIGAFETTKFLRAAGRFCGVDNAVIENAVKEREEEYYYYIERFSDVFLEQRVMSRRFAVVGDAHYALSVTKFLVNDMGLFPAAQFVMDGTPEKYRQGIISEFANLNYGIKAEVEFTVNAKEAHDTIRAADFAGNPLIVGSSWERKVTQEVNGFLVTICNPLVERMVINSHIAGYSGGLHLLEDIYTTARERLAL